MPDQVRQAVRRLAWRITAPCRSSGGGGVALTFDDGPDPSATPAVLTALERAGAVATFFLVGQHVAREPGLTAEIAEAGHAVGSHTWSHPAPGALGARELIDDVRRGRDAVEDVLGRDVTLFRPPQGHVDARLALAVKAARVRVWLWTHDPEDWRAGHSTATIVDAVTPLTPGAVVLLHDGLAGRVEPAARDRSATVAAVPALCEAAHAAGLPLVGLGEGRRSCDR